MIFQQMFWFLILVPLVIFFKWFLTRNKPAKMKYSISIPKNIQSFHPTKFLLVLRIHCIIDFSRHRRVRLSLRTRTYGPPPLGSHFGSSFCPASMCIWYRCTVDYNLQIERCLTRIDVLSGGRRFVRLLLLLWNQVSWNCTDRTITSFVGAAILRRPGNLFRTLEGSTVIPNAHVRWPCGSWQASPNVQLRHLLLLHGERRSG